MLLHLSPSVESNHTSIVVHQNELHMKEFESHQEVVLIYGKMDKLREGQMWRTAGGTFP